MRAETLTVKGQGGVALPGRLWLPEGEPRAVIQVCHGMTEHMGRYAPFAEAMAELGFAVAGFDLRGHGKNPGDPRCASFGEEGWAASLEDIRRLRVGLVRRFPRAAHVMLGFSLGSFLLRDYLRRGLCPDGVILLGTGTQPGMMLSGLKAVVKGQIRRAGFDKTTPLVRQMSFGAYNRKFAPNRTAADWLCADRQELDVYLADPLVRAEISSGLFWQLLDAMQRTGGPEAYAGWPKNLPVLVMSGSEDPVGDQGKGVRRLCDDMKKAGLNRVRMVLVPGARHDLLHERESGGGATGEKLIGEFVRGLLRETH